MIYFDFTKFKFFFTAAGPPTARPTTCDPRSTPTPSPNALCGFRPADGATGCTTRSAARSKGYDFEASQ